MANAIVVSVILIIISLSIAKIVSEKRRGAKCIGCPLAGSKNNNSGCGCH